MPDLILVHRLRDAYYPEFIQEYIDNRDRTLKAAIQSQYTGSTRLRNNVQWSRGRVRHFYNLFKQGAEVDPIEVDNEVHQYRVGSPISWGGPLIMDGHHRFIAAILAGKRKIWADVGGLVSTIEWLQGKRPYEPIPEEITS